MDNRVNVYGRDVIVRLINGGRTDADAGLILRGASQCIELADHLIAAAEEIMKNEKEAGGMINKFRY